MRSPADAYKADMRALYRKLTVDPQLRWLGPEKGILHMATGALLNAVWDLWAKAERKPPMPAKYAALPKDDLDALVAYLSSLKKK